jgi:hypothetical protein
VKSHQEALKVPALEELSSSPGEGAMDPDIN